MPRESEDCKNSLSRILLLGIGYNLGRSVRHPEFSARIIGQGSCMGPRRLRAVLKGNSIPNLFGARGELRLMGVPVV
jgi:hypothetical protein